MLEYEEQSHSNYTQTIMVEMKDKKGLDEPINNDVKLTEQEISISVINFKNGTGCPLLQLSKYGKLTAALLDTGAQISEISENLLQEIQAKGQVVKQLSVVGASVKAIFMIIPHFTTSINKLVQNIKEKRVENIKILRKNNPIYEIITNGRCPSPSLTHNENTDDQNQDSSNRQQESISIDETTEQATGEPQEYDPKLKVKPVIILVDIFYKYTKKARCMVNNMPKPEQLLKKIKDDQGRYVKKTRLF